MRTIHSLFVGYYSTVARSIAPRMRLARGQTCRGPTLPVAAPGAAPVEVRPLIPLQVVGIACAEFLASMRMLMAAEQSTLPIESHGPIDLSRNTSTRGNQQIRRNMETFAQTLHHRHAQFALAGHDLTDTTRSAQKRHKISAG